MDSPWKWSQECEQSFVKAKKALSSSKVPVHYNPDYPLKLAADASQYGVGAVISHTLQDGSEHPIAFASKTINPSEFNYAQIEEALALISGVRKFHKYLFGQRFTLVTDHKPLTVILGPKKSIPPLAPARLQRWAVLLSVYQYNIELCPTKEHCNADGLSCLPRPETTPVDTEGAVFNVSQMESLPISVSQLKQSTRTGPILTRVCHFTKVGWPKQYPAYLKPFANRQLSYQWKQIVCYYV